MYSDYYLPMRIPRNAAASLVSALIPLRASPKSHLLVILSLRSRGVIARDLSGYLTLLDHVYGRLDPNGLSSYAHRKQGHLTLSEVRPGSMEIILSDPVSAAERLAIVYLVAKYLPVFLRELVASYRDYQEAELAKVRRKRIEKEMRQDGQLRSLPDRHRKQLVELVDSLLVLEAQQLPSAQRLAQDQIDEIEIQVTEEPPGAEPNAEQLSDE
jgi:hypothetical protein